MHLRCFKLSFEFLATNIFNHSIAYTQTHWNRPFLYGWKTLFEGVWYIFGYFDWEWPSLTSISLLLTIDQLPTHGILHITYNIPDAWVYSNTFAAHHFNQTHCNEKIFVVLKNVFYWLLLPRIFQVRDSYIQFFSSIHKVWFNAFTVTT